MWFKQTQLFQLTGSMHYSPMDLCEKLGALEYEECLPSMPYGAGWISPVDEEGAPLVHKPKNRKFTGMLKKIIQSYFVASKILITF